MALFKTFGQNPSGHDLEKLATSPNYRNGTFHNATATQTLAKGDSFLKITWRFLNKPKNTVPPSALPSLATNLKSIAKDSPTVIWFGHSSYLININGKNILVDPVFSGHASPFSFTGKSFEGTDVYSISDLPSIDVLLLTHDHYDHLDYSTVLKLKDRVKRVITSLGVGSHLRYWGYEAALITELDWWDKKEIEGGLEFAATPARHFSGRTFTRNKTFWSSFILRSANFTIYIGSDSGYDAHFKTIGEKFGTIDLAILENGQYNEAWPDIHMMPEQTVQATMDLNANWLMPVHWGKFSISLHPWDEPIKRVVAKAKELNVQVTTPMIGEPVVLGENYPNKSWWEI
jgi:L-ascorbate metabolism protein UlaG (beta-lactamase superfamily)